MEYLDQLILWFSEQLPSVVQALLILIIGWLLALILSAIVRGVMNRFEIDDRLSRQLSDKPSFNIANLVSRGIFWFVFLLAIIGVLDVLKLDSIAAPLRGLLDQLISFVPNLMGGGLLILIAWIAATVVKKLISAALDATDWDERLSRSANLEEGVPLGESLGTLAYWLIWLVFLPGILDALGLQGILAPVQNMVDEVVAFLPNVFSAGIILVVGYFVARIVRDIITNLLATTGLDSLTDRLGLSQTETKDRPFGRATSRSRVQEDSLTLSGLIGTVVFALIIIPVAITALDALKLEALSAPAIAMLNQVLEAIPAIFAAGVLLAIAYFVARLISDIVSNILAGIGFNNILSRIGLSDPTEANQQPSKVVGTIILISIMLFASTEAANLLGFSALGALIAQFIVFFGQVLLGLVVLGLGLYLANLAAETIRSSGVQNENLLANFARYSILILTVTMALRQMGIAEDIVTLAFGLLLGAAAVAAALAFGLGGRQIAARELDRIARNMRGEPEPSSKGPRLIDKQQKR